MPDAHHRHHPHLQLVTAPTFEAQVLLPFLPSRVGDGAVSPTSVAAEAFVRRWGAPPPWVLAGDSVVLAVRAGWKLDHHRQLSTDSTFAAKGNQ